MESGLILVFGIGIVSLLVLYLAFSLDKEHFFFKLLLLFFLFPLLTLIGKVAIDYDDYCEIMISGTNVSGNYTSYDYDNYCFDTPGNTSNSFFKSLTWLMRFFYVYAFMYFNYDFWMKKWLVKMFRRFKRKK